MDHWIGLHLHSLKQTVHFAYILSPWFAWGAPKKPEHMLFFGVAKGNWNTESAQQQPSMALHLQPGGDPLDFASMLI